MRWLLLLAATLGSSAFAQTPPGPIATPAKTTATSATQWVAVRGPAVDLSITPTGDVYALDHEGRLWRLPAQNVREGTTENWLTQPGRFKRLRATHDGGLWAIGSIGSSDWLYHLRGSVWHPVLEGIKDVAASPDGQILVLNTKGELFDLYAGKLYEPRPPPSESASERLVADAHGLPWLQRQDRSAVRFDGTAWQAVASATDQLAALTAGYDGTILGIGLDGKVLRYMPQGNTWQPYITDGRVIPPLRHLAIHPSGMPWGIARSGELLAERSVGGPQKKEQSTPSAFTKGLTWKAAGGPSKKVSVGSDGTTFSIAPDGFVWRRKRGNEWILVRAQVEAIAAGTGGQAWGLNAKGGIVHFDKGFIFDIPGIARLIAAGPKNDLWAVFQDNSLQQWNARAKRWDGVMLLPEVPLAISIGMRGEPWIIDSEGMVKTYVENRWRSVPGITARSIGAGPEGTVYAASDAEGIYWLDAREMRWKPASGKAVQIAVGPGGAPWAITAKNELLASGRFIDADNVREAVAQAAAKKAASPTTPSSTTTADTTTASTSTAGSSTPSAFISGSSAPSAFTSGATMPDGTKPAIVFTGPLPATIKPLSYQTLFAETRFKDIGIGANGAVYAASVDGALMCFNNAANRFIIASSGTVDRVTVTADGMPWILDASGRISRFDKDRGAWRVVPSFSGVDISIGPDGQLWAAGTTGSVFRYNANADSFDAEPVVSSDVSFKARRVAGASARAHWLISEQNQLIRCEKGDCRVALTGALDAAVASDNTLFVLDLLGNVQRYNQSKKAFEKQNGLGRAIAVGPGGLPWLVNSSGNIDLAGIFNASSRTVNTADCAIKFASAPAPAPVPSTVTLVATADTASLFPGGSLDLLVNDSLNGRAPTVNDVTVALDTPSSFLTINGSALVVSSTATPGSVLTGSYKICARNVFGSCAAATFSITVAGTTTAPTGVSATAGNGRVTVSFTAPTSSSAINGYTAVASPGGASANGVSSPLTVSGLTNGVGYTFTVKAIYTNGTVKESDASTMVTPTALTTAPDSPTIGAAAAGNAQATVSFSAPTSTGGSAITGYTVTSSPGGLTVSGTASPLTVTGLTNGTAYIFTVTAKNAIGTGLPSAASNSVTPTAGATVPGAPTIGTASPGNAQAAVSFIAPASTGGSAITGYTVTASPGALSATGTASPLTVTGLTNGTAYTFTVIARNAIGAGFSSAASNSVTPAAVATVPGAPTGVTALAGVAPGVVQVSFAAPASNGGSAITSYTVTSSPGGLTGAGASSPIAVTGLTGGTLYTFTVTAVNAVGTGAASTASAGVTAVDVPGAPTALADATVPASGTITLTFSAPASTGGAAISVYDVMCIDQFFAPLPPFQTAGSPAILGGPQGVITGFNYQCQVAAENTAFPGSPGAPAGPVLSNP
ncbi:MAG: fibronectin type III domain-containing protein [Rhodocyclales bacterium]|nr:fibronectin type III domain-containing protein [Rhodocyclales bacterium]